MRRPALLATCIAAAVSLGAQAQPFDLGHGCKAALDPATGAWASLRTPAGDLAAGRKQAVVEICDLEKGTTFVPVYGPLDGKGQQRVALKSLGLEVRVAYEPRAGRVLARATVADTTGRDRGLVVRFCLPVDATGWRWWDDVQTTRTVVKGKAYQNVYPIRYFADLPEFRDQPAAKLGYHSRNFCAALTGPAGLALAFPLDEPRICRLTYDANEHLFYLAFDLALSRHTQPPNQASVSAMIYACDPKWGLRSALSSYYQWRPEFFTKHVKKEGIWMAFGDLESIDNVNEFGFQFQEGAANPGYDDKLGVYSLTYFTHAGLFAWIPNYDPEKDPPPSRERMVAAMAKRFERAVRTKGAFEAVGLGAPDGSLQIRKTAVYGHLISQFNLDPDLLYGRYKLDHMADTFAAYRKRGGELDGFYYDGITSGINYRTDHFQYASYPPVWDPRHKKPLLYNYFSSVEFAQEAARRLHAMGKYTMMNGAMASSPFAAPHLDIMGAETGLHIARPAFNYVRMICRTKPFVTLLKGNFSKFTHDDIERYIRRCVAYGVYPSIFDWPPSGLGPGSRYWEHAEWYERDRGLFRRYVPVCRQLNAAGWEPLTHAACSSPDVYVERFGKRMFTVLNDGADAVDCTLTIDAKAIGLAAPRLIAVDEVARVALPANTEAGKLIVPLSLSPGQLVVLHVAGKRELVQHHVAELERMLAARKLMREIDKARPELPVHWRTRRYGDGVERARAGGGDCLLLDNTGKPAAHGAWQWVMLYQKRAQPIEIRARVKAQGLAGKPDGKFAIRATVCYVTRFTKRVEHSFPLPRGDYDWRAVRFTIEPDRPVRSIHLSVFMAKELPGRAWVDDVVVAEAGRPDVNYAVDSAMDEWYELPAPAVAAQLEERFASVRAAFAGVKSAAARGPYEPTRVIAALGKAIDVAASARAWIDRKELQNPLRRARRDLDDCQSHLQLVLTALAGVTGPALTAEGPAIPGRTLVVKVAAQKAGQPAELADVKLAAEEGWPVKPLGAERFEVAVPKTAQVGDAARIRATARIRIEGKTWVRLSQERSLPVTRAITASLKPWGEAGLRLEVANHLAAPVRAAYEVICPDGWQARPARAEAVCAGRQARAVDLALVPGAATPPGRYEFTVRLSSPEGAFDAETLKAAVLYVPERLNLLKNPGFEQTAGARAANWGAYPAGYALDDTTAHRGKRSLKLDNPAPAKRGASQTITLKQKYRCPVVVRGWSKATRVPASAGRDYSLYVDIYHTDGTPSYGNVIQFGAGTHDWVFGEMLLEPKKPIRNINVYALHRRAKGVVWFDDLFVAEVPWRKGNLAADAKVSVDSCYSKYDPAPLTDGITRTEGLHWTEADWASADKDQPHWIELALPRAVSVRRVKVYWSLDAGTPRTSAEFEVQTKTAAGWTRLKRVRPAQPAGETTVVLDRPVTVKSLRIWQPAGAGPAGRPNLMWVREVEVLSGTTGTE